MRLVIRYLLDVFLIGLCEQNLNSSNFDKILLSRMLFLAASTPYWPNFNFRVTSGHPFIANERLISVDIFFVVFCSIKLPKLLCGQVFRRARFLNHLAKNSSFGDPMAMRCPSCVFLIFGNRSKSLYEVHSWRIFEESFSEFLIMWIHQKMFAFSFLDNRNNGAP